MESLFSFEEVRPVAPVAGYIGGKRQLAQRLAAIIEQIPHTLYAEPFIGMGGVFFRRRLIPKAEVINDVSGDVATFFRILQRHYPQFMETLRFQIASRREFDRLLKCRPETLTDLERAGRFLYLQRLAFGGKVVGRSFGVDTTGGARFNLNRLGPLLEDVHERLSGVVIENLDWSVFLDRYDRQDTLFFLDPPYFGCERDYGDKVFARSDFERLADRLADLRGRFMLTLNDCPDVRKIFARFSMTNVELTYTIAGGEGRRVGEVVIWDGRDPRPANLPLA
ncbi:DNA adenine methylase [Georhizobium profundi]|uniref:site-specific DNA-methyltransferase (adenine-specific) n=1 Tax=Georhizobium profundi TaxID=2341112 RepID=A0A3Q8XQ77_9HYPH|nr:DNA adenine methylase [Georhizobium profundi]AZN72720.1 DNA adenine methylase [Georhizobium profundi]